MTTKISLLLLFAALFMGCTSTRNVIDSDVREHTLIIDSVSEVIETRVQPITVPQATAQLVLTESEIKSLPANASYSSSIGRAKAKVTRTNDEIIFTADCDSVTLLLEHTNRELFRYKMLADSISQTTSSKEQLIIKEPTGWQWFQIYGFRILLVISALIFLIKKIVP